MRHAVEFFATTWQDIGYAVRTLRNNPVYAATAILTFALGIGAITAIFSIVQGVLLRPLPYRDPDRIMFIATGTIARFEEMKAAARSYTGLICFLVQPANVTLGGEEPEVLRFANVSANFLDVLGVAPIAGRSFTPEEDTAAGPRVAMISAELWRRRFAGDPSISGKTAILSGVPTTIVGVLPDGFQFPFSGLDMWMPKPELALSPQPQSPALDIIGRLKPGITEAQATAELRVFNEQYAAAHPGMLDARNRLPASVTPLKERVLGNVGAMLWMLFGAVSLVLLIACANVANLLLARSRSRSREFAVRAAIGAGRSRIVRQLLVESVLLASVGGLAGLLLGNLSLNLMMQMPAFNLPRASDIRLDATVLAFAALTSTITGLVFGLVPSLGVSNPDLANALKTGAKESHGRGSRASAALVVVQVALSIVLLIGAALLMQSVLGLYRVDLHFNPDRVLTLQMSLSPVQYDTNDKRVRFVEDLTARVLSLPGVRNTGVAWTLPFMGWPGTPVQDADQPVRPLNERVIAVVNNVNAGYFQTLEIPVRRGRLFGQQDNANASAVAIINETLARQLWPAYPSGPDPVGQRVLTGANPNPVNVVGVVGDIVLAPGSEIRPAVYRPYSQSPVPVAAFLIRADRDPMRFAPAIREQLRAIDRNQGITATRTLEDLLADNLGRPRLVMTLLELFAGVALILAIVGVYGVIAHTVMQRTREVGVRLALGARAQDIVFTLAGRAFLVTGIGIFIGIGGALGLTRFLKSYLFQTSPTEPGIFVAVSLVFVIVAAVASYLPLRRATQIDPMTVLRHD